MHNWAKPSNSPSLGSAVERTLVSVSPEEGTCSISVSANVLAITVC
jgi:hypothetical protein